MHTFKHDPLKWHSAPPETTVTVSTLADSVPDLCAAFEDYLRGCGYHFDGKVAIVPDIEDDLP